ncbi:MAG: type II toxin-antitoxin system RelE/ParE family toxin [Humibacillus sp.]|nr:type II toxin-antitoxin system RelE/ParE family toxin [Humibacillus sp.]MDN5780127.1 type II toxin-antitoxin system RelE/ParE family toxin [Humibacillus sp.]
MTSAWRVETTDQFDREFKKLDRAVQQRLLAYLHDVESLDEPRQRGKGLTANHAGVWRYRVGDYRILAQVIDKTLTVLALRVGHRRDVY